MRFESLATALMLLIILGASTARAGESSTLRLLPPIVGLNGELLATVSGPADADVSVILILASGVEQDLAPVITDQHGRAMIRADLAGQPVGTHQVSVRTGRQILATETLIIADSINLSSSEDTVYPDQLVEITADGLTPGSVEFRIDGIPFAGPEATDGQTSAPLRIPTGGEARLSISAVNRVGDRVMGIALLDIQRLRSRLPAPAAAGLETPATPLRPGQTFQLSGSVRLPDGFAPDDYDWMPFWALDDGTRIPMDVERTRFAKSVTARKGENQFTFVQSAVVPSLSTGYPNYDFGDIDEFGFVTLNPDTGEIVELRFAQPLEVGNEFPDGVIINGQVLDENTEAGLEGAVVTVRPMTKLFNPNDGFDDLFGFGANKASPNPADTILDAATAACLQSGRRNQYCESLREAQLEATTVATTATGCPVTLYNQATDENGNFQIAFSPKYTEFMSGLLNIPPPDKNTPFKGSDIRDQFLVRVSGLPLGYGVPTVGPDGADIYRGIRYEFRRDDDGTFAFRNIDTGEFTDQFSATSTLKTRLPQIPLCNDSDEDGIDDVTSEPCPVQVLPTNPYVLGLPPAANDDPDPVISKLFTFPALAGTALDAETVEFRLPWNGAATGLGALDATLYIDDVAVAALTSGSSSECAIAGTDYVAFVPGLATRQSGYAEARIEAAIASGQRYRKDFRIEFEQGPTWFLDPFYESFNVNWSPTKIEIVAFEPERDIDVSRNVSELEVGPLENTNEETAFARQTLKNGYWTDFIRIADTNTVVAGNAGTKTAMVELPGHNSPDKFGARVERAHLRASIVGKSALDDLLAREDAPTYGNKTFATLFDSGKIPLFRYVWGIPPIANATLGANMFFGAFFRYFVYVDYSDFDVLVSAVAQPKSNLGLEVFFDFSMIFSLVNASVSATPEIGVTMPIVVQDNTEADIDPCFGFDLELEFSVSVGWCPFCIKGSYDETPIAVREEPGCSLKRATKGGITSASPVPGVIAAATDSFGSTFVAWEDTDGIHAQQYLGSTPAGPEHVIDAGPGAMRPDVVFYDANKAVVAWSQSGLSDSAFQAQSTSEIDLGIAAFTAAQHQHLAFSLWDGQMWSAVQDLTLPTTGEGGVKLAACPATQSGCPVSGEVLAVWEKGMSADLSQHAIKLQYSIFNGVTWSTPETVDPANGAKDVQPSAAYVDGEPVIAWVRNPDASGPGMGLHDRRLMIEFLDIAGSRQEVLAAGVGVASPSLAVYGSGELGITFTRATEPGSFLGSRRSLWSGVTTGCSNGACTWFMHEHVDALGRKIYAERPKLVTDNVNSATVLFRHLGTSGASLPQDPVGVILQSGELVEINYTLNELLAAAPTATSPLTNDGAVNWQVAGTFDPTVNELLAFNAQGGAVAGAFKRSSGSDYALERRAARQAVSNDARGVKQYQRPQRPDLVLSDIRAEDAPLHPGQLVEVSMTVVNEGPALLRSASIPIAAYWDTPDLTRPADAVDTATLMGRHAEITMQVRVPVDFQIDERHRLNIIVNPERSIRESTHRNNALSIELGQLAVPNDVTFAVTRSGSQVYLDWDPADDDRVTSWRVYRRNIDTMEEFGVGHTPVNGFVDFNIIPGETYEYRVVALSERLIPSDSTGWITVGAQRARADQVFASGFEP